jgi:hypothetical protein
MLPGKRIVSALRAGRLGDFRHVRNVAGARKYMPIRQDRISCCVAAPFAQMLCRGERSGAEPHYGKEHETRA